MYQSRKYLYITGSSNSISRHTLQISLSVQFSSVQFNHSVIWLFATQWTTACQASLSITKFRSPPKPMSIESVMPSNHLMLYHPPLLLLSLLPSIRVFPMSQLFASGGHKVLELQLQHQSFQWIFRTDFLCIDTFDLAVQGTLKSLLHITVQKHQFFCTQLSL